MASLYGGPELGLTTIRNGQDIGRNIYWILNRLLLYQPYNKSVSITEDSLGVSRFLPEQLSLALLRFLVYVRPALSYLCKQVDHPYTSNDYLFRSYLAPRVSNAVEYWASPEMTRALRALSEPFGLDLNISSYRQIAITIAQNHLTPVAEVFNTGINQKSRLLAQQAGHNYVTAHLNYNTDVNFPLHLQPKRIISMRTLSEEWQSWLEQPTDWIKPEMTSSGQKQGRTTRKARAASPSSSEASSTEASSTEASISEACSSEASRSAANSPDVSSVDESESMQADSPTIRHVLRRTGKQRQAKVLMSRKRLFSVAFTTNPGGLEGIKAKRCRNILQGQQQAIAVVIRSES